MHISGKNVACLNHLNITTKFDSYLTEYIKLRRARMSLMWMLWKIIMLQFASKIEETNGLMVLRRRELHIVLDPSSLVKQTSLNFACTNELFIFCTIICNLLNAASMKVKKVRRRCWRLAERTLLRFLVICIERLSLFTLALLVHVCSI